MIGDQLTYLKAPPFYNIIKKYYFINDKILLFIYQLSPKLELYFVINFSILANGLRLSMFLQSQKLTNL